MAHQRLIPLVGACSLVFFSWLSRSHADQAFLRGAARGEVKINIADPVFILGYLFLGGDAPPCLDAADANDDGDINLSDAVYDLTYLFTGGLPPAKPFPRCGVDPTSDGLGCDSFRGCLCGGIAGFTCPGEGYLCEYATGTCDIVDNLGTCLVIPELCPENYTPVCGCDGVTYSNDCERQRAQAQKAHDGICIKAR